MKLSGAVLLIAVVGFVFVPSANAFRLPDTGQTRCFDASGIVIPCPVPGQPLAQDGTYRFSALSFTNNLDGTITDNNTGLMWQQNGNFAEATWYDAGGVADNQHNPGGETGVCRDLPFAGYGDWRLPTAQELLTILNYGYNQSADYLFAQPYFPDPDPRTGINVFIPYWSATADASDDTKAWSVSSIGAPDFPSSKLDFKKVRCVRGLPLQYGNFVDNGNGTVSDLGTGLTWQQNTEFQIDWASALEFCETSTLGGRADWRVPTIRELLTIVDYLSYSPAADVTFFPDIDLVSNNADEYWSSTTMERLSTLPVAAHAVSFVDGSYSWSGYAKPLFLSLRCVRGRGVPGLVPESLGVFRNGAWYFDTNHNGLWDAGLDSSAFFGLSTDAPLVGDTNGDGWDDIGVFRNGLWFFDTFSNGAWDPTKDFTGAFGLPGDSPVVGDMSADGLHDLGVFRSGLWFFDANNSATWDPPADFSGAFGLAGDLPVAGDVNGDGFDDMGIFRNGLWFFDTSRNGMWDPGIDFQGFFGLPTDSPVVCDVNGDGRDDLGVFRAGLWFFDVNNNGAWDPGIDFEGYFGLPGDKPVCGLVH